MVIVNVIPACNMIGQWLLTSNGKKDSEVNHPGHASP